MASILNFGGDSDSSEEDEELPDTLPVAGSVVATLKAFEETFLGRFGATSGEFQEASQLVLVDCWNVNAWLIMVEEVERGRGGNTSTVEVYTQFLDQFPRATKIWRSLIEFYLRRDDVGSAEDAFKSCLNKCRSADLWISYLALIKSRNIDKISKHSEHYGNAKKIVEAAFERAVENIGTMSEAGVVWRKYIDFVKEWPDMSPMDAGIKMKMLRGIYQRVVCLPVDDLDDFWREYEALETSAGEHLAAMLLPDLRAKNQHAKVVNRDRKRVIAKIAFDRIATPPTNSITELQQLDLWNRLIKFELENPGHLSSELHGRNMRCYFERALCCLRHHAEVWLAYSRFEQAQPIDTDESAAGAHDNIKISKAILMEGIECNSHVAILRVALAELEEASGNTMAARETLRSAFRDIPSAFTFSVLQRHIRRLDGKLQARKFFSDTMSARLDGALNFEVYLVHASLEMDVNQDLSAAIKAMEIARAVRPSLSRNLDYVRTCAAILRRLGDIEPIRWIFHNALGDDLCNAGKGNADNNLITSDQFVTDKKTRLTLWEDLLQIELKMGLSDIGRISIVREAVLKARSMAYPQGPPVIHATTALSPDEAVFFEYPAELFDKCNIPGVSLTLVDADMKNRCRGAALIDELVRGSDFDPNVADGGKKGRGKNSMEQGSALDADSSILAGLPAFFRELLTKLPPFNGSVPDIDAFVDNLRRTVLPPRPAEEPHGRRQQQQNEQVSTKGSILMKRGRQHNERSYDGGMDIIEDAEILGEHIDADMGFQAEEDAIAVMESRDDVFKRRHRQKIANE